MQFDDLKTFGVTYNKFTRDDLEFLYRQVDLIRNNFGSAVPANEELIGHIDHEYFLPEQCRQQLETLVLPMVGAYLQEYPIYNRAKLSVLSDGAPIFLRDAWVNFQKKYEYNPVHDHGVDTIMGISFTTWTKIPKQIADGEEYKASALYNSSGVADGYLQFHFGQTGIRGLEELRPPFSKTVKPEVGKLYMFPSWCQHCVYPFEGKGERRTVAGNLNMFPHANN